MITGHGSFSSMKPNVVMRILAGIVNQGWRAAVARTFVYSIGIRGVGAILALSLNVLLARLLGVAEYGRYMGLLSLILVLGGLSVRGVDSVLIRELAGEAGTRPALRKSLTRWATFRVGKSMGLAMLVFIAWSVLVYFGWPAVWPSEQVKLAIIAGAAVIMFSPFVAIQSAAINGYSASLRSQGLTLVVQNGTVLALLGVLYLAANRSIGFSQILWLQAGSYTISFLVGTYWLRGLVRKRNVVVDVHRFASIQNGDNTKSWTTASRRFLLVSMAALLVNKLDVVLVSALAGPEVVGVYAAGARLAQLAMIIALAVNVVLTPRIAKAYKAGEQSSVTQLVRSGLRFTIPIALGEVVLAWLFGADIVSTLGKSYSSSAGPFLWVVIAYALWTALAPAYALLSMTGRERIVAAISWLVLIINIGSIYILTPLYGADGAGAAMAIGYGVSSLIIFFIIVKQGRSFFR